MAGLGNLSIWINLHDSYISRTILEGKYEEGQVQLALSYLSPGATFLDIGANVGVYSLRAAEAVGPSGRVYSFEPRKDTFRMLQRSIEANGFQDRCTTFDKGLSEATGRASLHHWEFNHGASYFREEAASTNDEAAIQLTTLDSMDFGSRVDFVKIDVEGFETKVLRGASSFFKRYRPVVTSEVFPHVLRGSGGSSAQEYLELWENYGYEIRLFDGAENARVLRSTDLSDEQACGPLFNIVCLPR